VTTDSLHSINVMQTVTSTNLWN